MAKSFHWTWKTLHSWKWKHNGHSTELDMLSALTAVPWRARSSSFLRTRFALFIDNQSSLAVLVKSRSSSCMLNVVARKTAAILLCTLNRPVYSYTDTDRNPAEAGSRNWHATSKSISCTKRSSRHWYCCAQHALTTSLAVSSTERISTTVASTTTNTLQIQRCSHCFLSLAS